MSAAIALEPEAGEGVGDPCDATTRSNGLFRESLHGRQGTRLRGRGFDSRRLDRRFQAKKNGELAIEPPVKRSQTA